MTREVQSVIATRTRYEHKVIDHLANCGSVRTGLQLVAASQTYARLRQLRGKVQFSRSLAELKADR